MNYDDFLKGFLTTQERIRKILETSSPLDRFLEDKETRRKLLSPLSETARRLEESHKGYREQLSKLLHVDDHLSRVLGGSGAVLKSLESTRFAFEKLTEQSEAAGNAIARITKQFDDNKESLSSIANNILLSHSFETNLKLPQIEANLVEELLSTSFLQTDAFESITIDSHDSFQAINDFIAYTESSDEQEIKAYFRNLDESSKILIIWFINEIVKPIILGIVVYLLMESNYIQDLIHEYPLWSENDVHTAISRIPTDIDLQYYSDHRVITSNNVNLRDSPSMEGKVLEVMQIGTLVKKVSEVPGWTEVELYRDEFGTFLAGWVTSGYLTDLKR